MAEIREVLVLEDQFSSTFAKYIDMAQQASGGTSAVMQASDAAQASAQGAAQAFNQAGAQAQSMAQAAADATQQQAAQAQSASTTMQAAYDASTKEVVELVDQIKEAAEAVKTQAQQTQAATATTATAFSSAAADAQKLATQTNAAVEALKKEEDQADKNGDALNKMAKKSDKANDAAKKLANTLKTLATAAIVKEAFSVADELTNTQARLSMIADPGETADDLQAKIMASANRSRANYLDTAGAIGKMGVMAGDAFSSNDELIAFMETINKQFVIAGTSAEGVDAAMLQLTQAMSSGVLRGEELNSIFEQAPNIVKTIADYLDVPIGQIRDMASEGQITADVVKSAVLNASGEIDEQFESMPRTWAQVWNQIQNIAIQAGQPILDAISWVADNIEVVIGWITDRLDVIVPVLMGIAAAAAVAGGAMVASALSSAVAWAAVHWPLVLIAGLLTAIIFFAHSSGATFEQICGVIGGLFMELYAFVMNNSLVPMQNWIANLANFVGNVFKHPIESIQILFLDMAKTVLGYIRTIATGIENLLNAIPGITVNLTGAIDSAYNWAETTSQGIKDASGWTEYVKPWEYVDYQNAWNTGYSAGASVGKAIDDFSLDSFFGDASGLSAGAYSATAALGDSLDGINDLLGGIGGDVSDIKKDVSLAEEDVKMLIDMAERQYVNKINVQTNAPSITVNATSSGQGMDEKKLAKAIGKILLEQSASSTTKTYAVVI